MTVDAEALAAVLAGLAPEGLLTGVRGIAAGDEMALMPAEAATIATTALAARRASGAARILARELLARLGHGATAIPRGTSGAPVWPEGITGSLAHDDEVAVAVVARAGEGATLEATLGIDVEPAEPLPREVAALVEFPGDRLADPADPLAHRLLFAAKEAVYKAVFPRIGKILEWEDIRVDLVTGRAVTSSRHEVEIFHARAPRIVVLARVIARVIDGGRMTRSGPA